MPNAAVIDLAPRMAKVRRSPTGDISDRIRALRLTGRQVDNLGEGELDFATPRHICEAGHRAIDAGLTKYTAASGTSELKRAIVDKFHKENALAYDLSEVIAGPGAKALIFNGFLATVREGDEVIVPAPYWVSYPDMVGLADGRARIVACEEQAGWKLRPEALDEAITPATRWLVLNSPNNPTGAIYSAAELAAIAQVLLRHPHVLVMADDIYEQMRFDRAFATLPQVEPRLKSRTLLVNGVSKAYSMTGWRIGYAAGPAPLIDAMETLQSQSTSNPSSISQAAAVEALNAGAGFMTAWMDTLRERRDLVVSMLNRAPGLRCVEPEGAFYVFANCEGLIGKTTPDGSTIRCDLDVVTFLIDHAGVGVVHGAAFGASPYIRLAYGVNTNVLAAACARIVEACDRLAAGYSGRMRDTG